MTKKLVIRFVKFERALAMQILEQEGLLKATEHVKALGFPAIGSGGISLRGVDSSLHNNISISSNFPDNDARDEFLVEVIKWISEEQFSGSDKLEIGKECEFSDNAIKWFRGVFGGKSAKQLGEPRFFAAGSDILVRFKYVRPIDSCLQPKIYGDVYTWEMEVAE